jgi:hypothetical protein
MVSDTVWRGTVFAANPVWIAAEFLSVVQEMVQTTAEESPWPTLTQPGSNVSGMSMHYERTPCFRRLKQMVRRRLAALAGLRSATAAPSRVEAAEGGTERRPLPFPHRIRQRILADNFKTISFDSY